MTEDSSSPQNCVGFLFLDLHPPGVFASSIPPPPPPPLTPSFTHTHNFVTHHLSHTTLTHTHNFVTHAQLCHIQPTLSHTTFYTQLCHTPSFTHIFVTHHLSHTIFVTHHLHPPPLCVAGVAFMTLGWVWWRTWGPLVARDAGALLRGRRGTW